MLTWQLSGLLRESCVGGGVEFGHFLPLVRTLIRLGVRQDPLLQPQILEATLSFANFNRFQSIQGKHSILSSVNPTLMEPVQKFLA